MSKRVNQEIAKNKGNINYYNKTEIQLVQLWAKVCFGETLVLDGLRGNPFFIRNSESEKLTNLYIYRQEFISRKDVIDARKKFNMSELNELLNLPNLSKLLESAGDLASQHRVFDQFLEFFLKIKRDGLYFENKVGNENMTLVLNGMVSAEKYKNTTIEEYFKETQVSLGVLEQNKKSIKDAGYNTMYDYYQSQYLAYKDVKIDDLLDTKFKEALEKEGYKLVGDYFQEMFLNFSEEPQKSLTIDEYYKDIESYLQKDLELKADIQSKGFETMGAYFDASTRNYRKQIMSMHEGNVDENTSISIGNKLNTLSILLGKVTTPQADPLTGSEKESAKNLCTDLLDIANQTNNNSLKEQVYLYIPVFFNTTEIKNIFGENVVNAISTARVEVGQEFAKYEEINDILAQIDQQENKKNTGDAVAEKRGINLISEEEFKKNFPLDHKSQETTTLKQDNTRIINNHLLYQSSLDQSSLDQASFNYQKLSIPGIEPIYVKMRPDEVEAILELLSTSKPGYSLILPNYKKRYFGGSELHLSDFSYAKKENNKDYTVWDTSLNKKQKTITVEEQEKARRTNNLALLSTQTFENRQLQNEVNVIQSKMSRINTLYDKMSTAKIDWKNVNWAGVLFTTAMPVASFLTSSSLNDYIPVDGGLDEKGVEEVFSNVFQIKDSLEALQASKDSIEKVRDQLLDMQKNIDRSKLTTQQELQILQATNAANFLLDAIKDPKKGEPLGPVQEFLKFMENPKNVSANGTLTQMGKVWLRDNGLKFLLAIGFAVGVMAAPFSGGASLLGVAALGTVGGMVGSRVGQWLNVELQNWASPTTIMVNGEERKLRYSDPTDIKMLIEKELTPSEFLANIGVEFAVGTVSVYGFMLAGRTIGGMLSKYALKNPKAANLLNKIKPDFMETADPYSKTMFNDVVNGTKKPGFWQKFLPEFKQELGEETMESLAESSGIPGLAMLVTTWNCLSPSRAPKVYAENKVSLGKMDRVGNNLEMNLHYEQNSDHISDLISHFEQQNFKLQNDGTLHRTNEVLPTITDVIRLVPSQTSIEIRSLSGTFEQFNMKVDHNSENNVIVESMSDLLLFKIVAEKNNLGTIEMIGDGTYVLRTSDANINLTLRSTAAINTVAISTKNRAEVHPKVVEQNAQLDDGSRIKEAERLLGKEFQGKLINKEGKVTDLGQSVLDAHNADGSVFNLTFAQVRAKVKLLYNASFDFNQIAVLLDYGICGKIESKTLDTNMDGKIDANDVKNLVETKSNLDPESRLKIAEQYLGMKGQLVQDGKPTELGQTILDFHNSQVQQGGNQNTMQVLKSLMDAGFTQDAGSKIIRLGILTFNNGNYIHLAGKLMQYNSIKQNMKKPENKTKAAEMQTELNNLEKDIKSLVDSEIKGYNEKMQQEWKAIQELEAGNTDGKWQESFDRQKKMVEGLESFIDGNLASVIGVLTDVDGAKSILKSTREIGNMLYSIKGEKNAKIKADKIKKFNEHMEALYKSNPTIKDSMQLTTLNENNIDGVIGEYNGNNLVENQKEFIKDISMAEYEMMSMNVIVYGDATNYESAKQGSQNFKQSLEGKSLNDNYGDTNRSVKDVMVEQITDASMTNEMLTDTQKTLNKVLMHMTIETASELGRTAQQTFELCSKLSENVALQTIEASFRQLGDHGISHILGNINMVFSMMNKSGKYNANYRMMTIIGMVAHDLGYANRMSAATGEYDGTGVHPFTSTELFKSQYKSFLGKLGIDVNTIARMITVHDGVHFDLSTPEGAWFSMCKLADNFAIFSTEKFPPLIMNHPQLLYDLYLIGRDSQFNKISEDHKNNLKEKIKELPISQTEKNGYLKFVNEMSPRTLKTIFGMVEGSIDPSKFKVEIDDKGIRKIIIPVEWHSAYIHGIYNDVGNQLGKPFFDYLEGGATLFDITGKKPLKTEADIEKALKEGGVIMQDVSGNQLIYQVNQESSIKVDATNGDGKVDLSQTNAKAREQLLTEKNQQLEELNNQPETKEINDAKQKLQHEIFLIEVYGTSDQIITEVQKREAAVQIQEHADLSKQRKDINKKISELNEESKTLTDKKEKAKNEKETDKAYKNKGKTENDIITHFDQKINQNYVKILETETKSEGLSEAYQEIDALVKEQKQLVKEINAIKKEIKALEKQLKSNPNNSEIQNKIAELESKEFQIADKLNTTLDALFPKLDAFYARLQAFSTDILVHAKTTQNSQNAEKYETKFSQDLNEAIKLFEKKGDFGTKVKEMIEQEIEGAKKTGRPIQYKNANGEMVNQTAEGMLNEMKEVYNKKYEFGNKEIFFAEYLSPAEFFSIYAYTMKETVCRRQNGFLRFGRYGGSELTIENDMALMVLLRNTINKINGKEFNGVRDALKISPLINTDLYANVSPEGTSFKPLYRGLGFNKKAGISFLNTIFAKKENGEYRYIDKAFVSSTDNKEVTMGFMTGEFNILVEIKDPFGGIYIKDVSAYKSESETVFNAGFDQYIYDVRMEYKNGKDGEQMVVITTGTDATQMISEEKMNAFAAKNLQP